MADKILFVDDEPPVLDGYKRMLHREFAVDTAVGGEQGLAAIHARGPYSVVISDMRMPGMNGAQFLARLRQTAPDTVRILLTGYLWHVRTFLQLCRLRKNSKCSIGLFRCMGSRRRGSRTQTTITG